MVVLISPILLLCLAELALRLGGYGYPTTFFKPFRIGDRDYWVENDKFGLRFFPPELARSPPPAVMEAVKPANVRRVFLLGESAALGDPRPAYGAGRYLQVLLEERFPEFQFEVVCVAVTAINSHAILPIARECARHEGDLWIVYMGNNEMVGPYGACTVFGAQAPPLWRVRLTLAMEETRLGQLALAKIRPSGARSGQRTSWGGMRMFTENQIGPRDARKEVVYRSFEQNLKDILRAGKAAGVPVLLSTVAVNLKDCPPFASLPAPDQRSAAAAAYAGGAAAEERGDLASAVRSYKTAASLEPDSAELQFRLGRSRLALAGDHAGPPADPKPGMVPGPQSPLACFERACDADALPFRADSRMNAIIRAAAAPGRPGLELCDADGVFRTNSPIGIPGNEAFHEHVHFNFDGNYALARAWAGAAERLLALGAGSAPRKAWGSQGVCEQRLALTEWNRYAVLEDLLQRLASPPFTQQAGHARDVERVRTQLREVGRRLTPEAAAAARKLCREALTRRPEDHRLHENAAQFLEGAGDLRGAAEEWRAVRGLIPQHHLAWFQEGRLLARLQDLAGASEMLERSVSLRPDLVEGWLELGNLHAQQKQMERALQDYQRGLDLAPAEARLHYHAAKVQSKLNRSQLALQGFRHAVELRPDYWEARYALGEELAFTGQEPAARKEFEEVLRLNPDCAMAHLNLGVGLLREKDAENALRHFEAAARLDPKNPVAQKYLGQLRGTKK